MHSPIQAIRLDENPLITPQTDPSIGTNINGPSLIRVPAWVERPLGRYYLYFADHGGKYIRMAYADRLGGPWRVHAPGVLHLDQTICRHHVASPDVHVLHRRREIRMYFHGPVVDQREQCTFVAQSSDGLSFTPQPQILGPSYFRVFRYRSAWYAIAMTLPIDSPMTHEVFLRSPDGVQPFVRGPNLLDRGRHTAVLRRGDRLLVFFSLKGDLPERILATCVDLRGDWRTWREGEHYEVIAPVHDYEGADLPVEPSSSGAARGLVCQLRDPAVYVERGRPYLLYSIAGESGIGMARLKLDWRIIGS